MNGHEELRSRWIAERPMYEAFARCVRDQIKGLARQRGIVCSVDCRAKEVDSLLKKQLIKKYASPWEQIVDKAGVRIILPYADTVPDAQRIVEQAFDATQPDNKAESLGLNLLGYLGIHYEVKLREEGIDPDLDQYRGMIAEVQIHTRAQNVWAEVSHSLSYKTPQVLPADTQRLIYLLEALMEVFDREVTLVRRHILTLPGREENMMLAELEKHYFYFSTRTFDPELSLCVVTCIKPLFQTDEPAGLGHRMDQFVDANRDKLTDLFSKYADDNRSNLLLFQPESLLIFERLEWDHHRLMAAWESVLPIELLEGLAVIWGRPLPSLG
jgi:ppGpp synthetase/RelA/SpoT-type nucleotidyltranferase